MSEQCVFDFDAIPKTADSLTSWREARAKEIAKMCFRLGLPIGHQTEVRFANGTILRGLLRLAEENLLFDADRKTVILQIDKATFRFAEIAAVVRSENI